MKLLHLSSDLREITRSVKRLLRMRVRCAVCEYSNSQVGVWVQHDTDFLRASKIIADEKTGRALPPWASLLGEPLSAEHAALPLPNHHDGTAPVRGGAPDRETGHRLGLPGGGPGLR